MAVSKKPRHKRKPNKGHVGAFWMPQKTKDDLLDLFRNVHLMCELKLHTGTCTYQDIAKIRDVLNGGTWFATRWRDRVHMDEDTVEAYSRAQDAFHDLYHRGLALGALNDETVRFVCRGPEIEAIKDGVSIATDFLLELIDMAPFDFFKTWNAMKDFLNGKGVGRVSVERDVMEKEIDRRCRR